MDRPGRCRRRNNGAITLTDFYSSYIRTCVELGVRLLKSIGDISAFIQFTRRRDLVGEDDAPTLTAVIAKEKGHVQRLVHLLG